MRECELFIDVSYLWPPFWIKNGEGLFINNNKIITKKLYLRLHSVCKCYWQYLVQNNHQWYTLLLKKVVSVLSCWNYLSA